ncbi:unnamed protein product [Chrysoparadoxa australica]
MAQERQLKIKTGVCRRMLKEVSCYEEEAATNEAKVQKMKDEGMDSHDIAKQEEVLQESLMMIPDSTNRLEKALEDLRAFVEENRSDSGLTKSAHYAEAMSILSK